MLTVHDNWGRISYKMAGEPLDVKKVKVVHFKDGSFYRAVVVVKQSTVSDHGVPYTSSSERLCVQHPMLGVIEIHLPENVIALTMEKISK